MQKSYVFGQARERPYARIAAILEASPILLGRSEPRPPRKHNSTFALEGLGGRPKPFDIENASGHDATEGVFCCVVFGFRDCPGSGDGFMRESELLPGET
jgi:hypothetical protein